GIEPDGDGAGNVLGRGLDQCRVAHRCGADDHAGDALAEPRLDRREVADAATELQRYPGDLDDALDRGDIHGLAGERAIEIDDVQVLEALRLEGLRLPRRLAKKHRRARHAPLLEPHADPILEVNRGEENHGRHFRKLAISLSPTRWLFSGWNWVPTMVSRPTMAVTGPP